MSIVEPFAKAFGCAYPAVLAPMGGIAGSKLASAFANAGGIGFVGTGGQNKFKSLHFISVGDIARKLIDAQNAALNSNHIGVGFVIRDQLERDPTILNQIITLMPRNIWISGDNFETYANIVLKTAEYYQPLSVFVQVTSLDGVRRACKLGVDAIVLKDAGRAGGWLSANLTEPMNDETPFLETMIPEARKIISFEGCPASTSKGQLPLTSVPWLIAAGGIHTRQDIQRILALGADAVCLGSRLAMARESELSTEDKISILNSFQRHQSFARRNPDSSEVVIRPPGNMRMGEATIESRIDIEQHLLQEFDEGFIERIIDENRIPTVKDILKSLFDDTGTETMNN